MFSIDIMFIFRTNSYQYKKIFLPSWPIFAFSHSLGPKATSGRDGHARLPTISFGHERDHGERSRWPTTSRNGSKDLALASTRRRSLRMELISIHFQTLPTVLLDHRCPKLLSVRLHAPERIRLVRLHQTRLTDDVRRGEFLPLTKR